MKVTIKLDTDWEIEAEIPDDVVDLLNKKKGRSAGYARVSENEKYYFVDTKGCVGNIVDNRATYDEDLFAIANYYTSENLAENNARADTLMRKLRRFAVASRKNEFCRYNSNQEKFYIYYNCKDHKLGIDANYIDHACGITYFDSKESAQAAIDNFHDELIWYFTEYKDSI